jgi:PhoPQ-activated pathogenicity-related protein
MVKIFYGRRNDNAILSNCLRLAVRTNTIAAVLYQVPNQPCGFSDDEWHPRSEDDIIAYTWAHFIRNPEEVEWPLHIPMTKAAVRALDTLQTYACKHLKIQVSTFAFAVPRSFKTFVYLLYYMKILQVE